MTCRSFVTEPDSLGCSQGVVCGYRVSIRGALELLPLALSHLADVRQLPLDEAVLHLQLSHARPQRRRVDRRQVVTNGKVHLPCISGNMRLTQQQEERSLQ